MIISDDGFRKGLSMDVLGLRRNVF